MNPKSVGAVPFAQTGVEKGISASPVDFQTVPVKVSNDSAVAIAFQEAYLSKLETTLNFKGGVGLEFVQKNLTAYLNSLLASRVYQVTGGKSGKRVVHTQDKIAIPTFFAVLLSQVGPTESVGLGLSITPIMEVDGVELLSPEDMRKFSMILMGFEDMGFSFMVGLPRDHQGSWEVMSMEVVEEAVRSYSNTTHPSYAIIASYFAVSGMAHVLGAQAFRVQYTRNAAQASQYAYDIAS